jgi:integrase
VQIADALVRVRRAWKVASPYKADDALAFGTSTGAHENCSNVISRGLRPALKAAGITRNIGLHDCRHTFCSTLLSAGVDVLRVSRLMGHASADITLKVYGDLITQGRDDSAERLATAMLGASCNESVTSGAQVLGSANDSAADSLNELVPEIGIEPTTYALRMRRSTN